MRSILTQHDVDQLRALYADLPAASWKAVNRLRVFPPANALEGEDLRRFHDAHDEVMQLIAKMARIIGD